MDYWSFILRGKKKKTVSLLLLLSIAIFAMFSYVSVTHKKKIEQRSASYSPGSYIDNNGMRVIVGYYVGKANGKAEITDEEMNANNYSPIPGAGENGAPVMMQQRELIRSKELSSLHYFNILASDKISINRSLPDMRSQSCIKIQYEMENLPTASVIIIFHNEAWSTLMRTITSVLIRSPDKLLKEIIIVDDASTRKYLGAELEETISKMDKVRLLRQTERKGLVSARLLGARSAAGDVLVFLDAHCETTPGWLEPLLDRAGSDDVFVCPHIDIISDESFTYTRSVDAHSGAFSWRLSFRWIVPSKEVRDIIENHPTKPYPTPAMAGGLFAVRKSLFWRLGGYDEGMKIWGSENIEMSWRAWLCGAKIEIVPCSRVGHIFRKSSPYTSPVHAITNTARAALVWLDDWTEFFFKFQPEAQALRGQQNVSSMIELRKKLNCKSFQWYLENVWKTHHYPTYERWYGRIRNYKDYDTCLVAQTGYQVGVSAIAQPCGSDTDQTKLLVYTPEGLIASNDILCLEYIKQISLVDTITSMTKRNTVSWNACTEGNTRQIWHQKGPRLKNSEGLCLTLTGSKEDDKKIMITRCKRDDPAQKWHLERVPWR